MGWKHWHSFLQRLLPTKILSECKSTIVVFYTVICYVSSYNVTMHVEGGGRLICRWAAHPSGWSGCVITWYFIRLLFNPTVMGCGSILYIIHMFVGVLYISNIVMFRLDSLTFIYNIDSILGCDACFCSADVATQSYSVTSCIPTWWCCCPVLRREAAALCAAGKINMLLI